MYQGWIVKKGKCCRGKKIHSGEAKSYYNCVSNDIIVNFREYVVYEGIYLFNSLPDV